MAISNIEKLDAILIFLENELKGLIYDTSVLSEYLTAKYPDETFFDLNDLIRHLRAKGLIMAQEFENKEKHRWDFQLRILTPGSLFINAGGFTKEESDRQELAKLNKEKLDIDIKNAQRVYKSYRSTRFIAWAGFILTILAIVLKILESNHLWPFRK